MIPEQAGRMNGDPSQLMRFIDWGWALILGLVALVWRQQRASVDVLEKRVEKLEQANGRTATKDDLTRLENMIHEHNRKLDETIERNHDQFMRIMGRRD